MMALEIERAAELLRAAEDRFVRAGAHLEMGERIDAAFCLRSSAVFWDLAKAVLAPFESDLHRSLREIAGPDALHVQEMRQIVARSPEPSKAWETFERAYWDARKGEPIQDSTRAYMRGYRFGQAANRASGR